MKNARLRVPKGLKLRIHNDGKVYGQISKSNGEFYLAPEILAALSYFSNNLNVNPVLSRNLSQYLKKHFKQVLETLPNDAQCDEIINDLIAAGFLLKEQENSERPLQADGFGDPWIQWAMISDKWRCLAYEKALKQLIHKGSIVLDVGAGTGLLSAYALAQGAKKVYAIEESNIARCIIPNLKNLNLISKKGDSKNFTLYASNSFDVSLSNDINLVVSELFGNDPFQEGLYSTLRDISQRLKNKNIEYIPQKLFLYGEMIDLLNHPAKDRIQFYQSNSSRVPDVSSPFYDQFVKTIKKQLSFDSVSFPINLTANDFSRIGETVNLGESFLNPPPKKTQFIKCFTGERDLKVDHKTEGVCVFIFWFRAYLTNDISISSHPKEADYATHWSPIAVVLNKQFKAKTILKLKHNLSSDASLFECRILENNSIIGARI